MRAQRGAIWLTLFLDLVGFSIIFPLIADLLTFYRERGDHLLELVDGLLLALWPGADDAQRLALLGGVIFGLFALAQFICAPIWGALSDRIGRRPVLLITVTGSLLSYVLLLWAGTFSLFVGARVLGGMMSGNAGVVSAAMADVSTNDNRLRNMALIGIAFATGFICGPAIGSAAYGLLPAMPPWELGAGLAITPFSTAALAAVGLSFLNLLWVAGRFTETHQEAARQRVPGPIDLGSRVRRLCLIYGCYTLLLAGWESTLVFALHDRMGLGGAWQGLIFVYMGLVSASVQGGIVRRLSRRVGSQRLARVGMLTAIPAFLLLALMTIWPSWALLLLAATGMMTSVGLCMPSLASLLSESASGAHQGRAFGRYRAMGAISRVIGPLIAGLSYFLLGPAIAYAAAALAALAPLAMTWRLPALTTRS